MNPDLLVATSVLLAAALARLDMREGTSMVCVSLAWICLGFGYLAKAFFFRGIRFLEC